MRLLWSNTQNKEPLAWSDFYIARRRLLARVLQNGVEAQRLLDLAQAAGRYFGTPELRAVLDS
jgi:hypothetical protein